MGVTVDVIVPAAAWDGVERKAARAWVVGWWMSRGYSVKVAELAQQPWSKGRAVNRALAASDADVVIVADADSWLPTKAVDAMVAAAGRNTWVVPFERVMRLCEAATRHVLATDPALVDTPSRKTLAQKPHAALAGGGIIAAHRDVWALVGGFDPRFEDWGGEDYSLGCALRTMTGRDARRLTGELWHLWHPPQENTLRESKETSTLSMRYRKAKFRPDEMTRLLDEWRADA